MLARAFFITLAVLNNAYFFTCLYLAFGWDRFHYSKLATGSALSQFLNSALVEEYGLISYFIAMILFLASHLVAIRYKRLWMIFTFLPILIASGIVLWVKFALPANEFMLAPPPPPVTNSL